MLSLLLARRLFRILASAFMVSATTWIAYSLHTKAFIAGFLYLLVVLPIAFVWGFLEATVASIMAVACLDYFFTQPLFAFYMSDPQDWVALSAFETVILIVSRLAGRLRNQAIEMAAHEENVDRLYTMSRQLLLIDHGAPAGAQLARLITEIFGISTVGLWDARAARLDVVGPLEIPESELREAYSNEYREDDAMHGKYIRPLSLGSRTLGALCILSGHNHLIDARTVDAIASLVAIALERARAFVAEGRAEASRQSEQLRSAVLDGLAHAFKTPLATIEAATSGLLEIGRLDSVEEELVTAIQTETQHLSNLTSRALKTARLEDKQLKVQRALILIEPFLQTDWLQLARGIADHQLKIEAGDVDCAIWADAGLLEMALTQFLDNASKYAEPASPVRLCVKTTDSETVFSIHNLGSYIAPEDRERIFERFYRSQDSRYRVAGTGIGLTVAKQIAEAHHGRVWVESDRQKGTTFYMGLPRIKPEVR